MSDPITLFRLRQRNGQARQPSHLTVLNALNHLLRTLDEETPYSLRHGSLEALLNDPLFTTCARGCKASIPDALPLYRLIGIGGLIRDCMEWQFENDEEHLDVIDGIWRKISQDSKLANDWLRLDSYSQGTLSGFRGVSWWTSANTLVTAPVTTAHALGMPNDWIPVRAVILRHDPGPTRPSDDWRVPSTIDAYHSEVFHTTVDADLPASGLTISLQNLNALKIGNNEYVVLRLDVRSIQLWPVVITHQMRANDEVLLGPALRSALQSYYSGL